VSERCSRAGRCLSQDNGQDEYKWKTLKPVHASNCHILEDKKNEAEWVKLDGKKVKNKTKNEEQGLMQKVKVKREESVEKNRMTSRRAQMFRYRHVGMQRPIFRWRTAVGHVRPS
jgi:hypothetical protein